MTYESLHTILVENMSPAMAAMHKEQEARVDALQKELNHKRDTQRESECWLSSPLEFRKYFNGFEELYSTGVMSYSKAFSRVEYYE